MKIPPPLRWDETIDGLEDASRWAADYERSLLPSDIIFPRAGQVWAAVRDCEVNFIAFIPMTILPGGRAKLQRGERVRIYTHDAKPIYVSFRPVRYEELQSSIVPSDVRNRPGYHYYWLSLRIARTVCCLQDEPGFFHELFRLVEDVA
jgi:hypothetical protein